MNQSPILAAGGVVVRAGAAGTPEVLVVHRPRYDDWSLPKGKDDEGETPEEAALREVWEETGQRTQIIGRLPDVGYMTPTGGPKLVRYFLMRPLGRALFEPNKEVDQVRWLPIGEARDLLSYDHDRDLVDHAAIPAGAKIGAVYLIRHAHAGNRSKWEGDDADRPLSPKGRRQSDDIAAHLAELGIDRILSSRFARCVETVEPLADATGLPIEVHELLAEGSDVSGLLETIERTTGNIVMCSHGDVIPELLDRLLGRGLDVAADGEYPKCPKASIWRITIDEGVPTVATYRPPPEMT